MLTHRATRRWRTTGALAISLIAAVALMATVVFVPGAGAIPEQKSYTAVVSPDVSAGQTIPFTLTIVNTTKTQQIGSANLSAPSSFSLISAVSAIPGGGTATIAGSTGGTVQLRNLALPPGGARTATFTAEVPCANGDYTWSIIAKQSNNFSGPPGNNFTLTPPPASDLVTNVSGQCTLEWVAQPQDARTGDRITNTQYDDFLGTPGPDFIEVEVLSAPYSSNPADPTLVSFSTDQITLDFGNDASGGTATLGGTVSVNADGGVATFDPGPTIDVAGPNYTLVASAPSNSFIDDSPPSSPFDISDAVCEVKNGTCTTPLTGVGGTRARATIEDSTVDGGFVAVSVGVLIDAVYCSGYTPPPGEQAVAILPSGLAGDPTLFVEATLDASTVDAGTVSWSQLKVCWAQTSPFIGLNGPAPEVTIAGELQRQDLLLGCDPSGKDLVAPCQLPSIRDNRTGAVTLRVFASGTDPYKR
jgi:hypothetical protein